MDRLDQLAVFVRVAELGSFSAAAEQLGLPRSTVSAAVQRLEARLGTRLIQRTTRSVRTTADGAGYLEWARGLLADIEEGESQFRGDAPELRGRLRVDMPPRLAGALVVPALPAFLARHPRLDLELSSTDRPVDLLREGIDCAIRVGGPLDPALVARPLGRLAQGSYASPGYLARHGEPRTPDALAGHLVVDYLSPGSGRVDPWEVVEDGVARRLALRARIAANSADSYIAAGIAGLGMVQLPVFDARRHVASGELVEVLRGFRPPPVAVHLLHPALPRPAARLRAFAEWAAPLFDGIDD